MRDLDPLSRPNPERYIPVSYNVFYKSDQVLPPTWVLLLISIVLPESKLCIFDVSFDVISTDVINFRE